MKENKSLIELGSKKRAGHLLSSYIRAIAVEKTEIVDVAIGPDECKKMIISKAEAMARDIWEQALTGTDKKLKLEYRKLILDRVEGKPGTEEELKDRDVSIPDKISDINKRKLNEIAKKPAKKKQKT